MTDRELLELAAKAAGFELVWGDTFQIDEDEVDCSDMPYVKSNEPDVGDIFWNPLTEDGDAFRLAIKLELDVMCASVRSIDDSIHMSIYAGIDIYAATRRAIVCAAAEIGKVMS